MQTQSPFAKNEGKMGGGAMMTPVGGGATTTNLHSSLPPPVSANSSVPSRTNRTTRSLYLGEIQKRPIQCRDQREDDDRAVGSYYDSVFRPVPSPNEVQKAISDLQRFMVGFRTSEFDWLQQMIYLHNPSMLKSLGFGSVNDSFPLLQTDPSVQRMVTSISSDKAVWDAILRNKAVQNLQQSLCAAKEERSQSSSEEPDLPTLIVNWFLDIAKAKVVELIEQFISLVTKMFQPPPEQKNKIGAENTDGQLDYKLRSSLLLSLVVFLIVVVTRAQGV